MKRRSFLIGLFGTAAVAAAGPIPKIIKTLPEKTFIAAAKLRFKLDYAEIYGNDKGDYAFATLKYLEKAPWFEIVIPDGFRPLREESERLAYEAIQAIGKIKNG